MRKLNIQNINFECIYNGRTKEVYCITYTLSKNNHETIERDIKIYIQYKSTEKENINALYYWAGDRWIPLHGDHRNDKFYFWEDWKKWVTMMLEYDFITDSIFL